MRTPLMDRCSRSGSWPRRSSTNSPWSHADVRNVADVVDVVAALTRGPLDHWRVPRRRRGSQPARAPRASGPALVRRGIVVVASAGNLGVDPRTGDVGYGGITSPANGLGVIAVGAVNDQQSQPRRDDQVTNYSSRGPTRFD
ncbi:MAG: S8 family serine peptidase, partial [Solirubrobacterales bacterium]|nr:S8 family serine peptidase [Solirubrobacterales bacterium]